MGTNCRDTHVSISFDINDPADRDSYFTVSNCRGPPVCVYDGVWTCSLHTRGRDRAGDADPKAKESEQSAGCGWMARSSRRAEIEGGERLPFTLSKVVSMVLYIYTCRLYTAQSAVYSLHVYSLLWQ